MNTRQDKNLNSLLEIYSIRKSMYKFKLQYPENYHWSLKEMHLGIIVAWQQAYSMIPESFDQEIKSMSMQQLTLIQQTKRLVGKLNHKATRGIKNLHRRLWTELTHQID